MDVEGSTRLLHELGAEAYAQALAEHRLVVREACARHGGVEVDTQGDAFFVAFPTAPGALAAAGEIREGLARGPIRLRMGLHTGTPHVTEEGYVGVDVHRAARIAASGHGGQVLVSASTAALVGPDDLRDLGEHRLKDLAAPERVYQLGQADFPPLKTLYRTNLPVPATPFLGREAELREVLRLVEGTRLLTLTGPGGTGKTRLALQAAAEASDRFPDGVFWVPLAPLRDPELVLEAAGEAVGANDGLSEHIADKSVLLLLDNFEHVVDAAVSMAQLLSACPNLELLVTSRELLRVPGEQAYPVPPLDPRDGEELFLARALAARPDFEATPAVSELCARLENLPLALELAAARVRVLSPERLLERLSQRLDLLKGGRGIDPRQQTLRATIEWSHELLDADEQRLFARLAVFRGGCTLDAAEAVCDTDLDTLESLVDKSLVRVRGDRFWMLETIREYAVERLEASGEADEQRRRHAEYFAAMAAEAEPELIRGRPQAWLDRLEPEQDNFRAALDRLHASDETQLALRLAATLFGFWMVRGHFVEARRRLEQALAADARPTVARARALVAAAHVSGDANEDYAEEALRLSLELGDRWGAAYARFALGATIAEGKRDWARAREVLEESRQAFIELGDDHFALVVTRSVAWVTEELGDKERYRELVAEYLQRAQELGNERVEARGLGALAVEALEQGRHEDARELMVRSYEIDRRLGYSIFIGIDLVRFAMILLAQGQPAVAIQLVSRADRLYEDIGVPRESWAQRERDETLAESRTQLDEAAFEDAWERGWALELDEAVALAGVEPG
jgi:predicted ATPase